MPSVNEVSQLRVLVNPTVLAPVGGVEMSVLQVSRELAERGHSISVLYQHSGSLSPQWESFAEELIQVPTFDFTKGTAVRDLNRLRPSVRAAAGAAPDVVYLNRAEQSVWGLLAARAAHAPLVTHLRGLPEFPAVGIVGRLTGAFVAISHFIRDQWVQAGLRPDDVSVVHNGIDPDDYPAGGLAERAAARSLLGIPPDAFVVLYYGRVAPGKGVEVLLDAWRTLGLPPESATLLIVDAADEAGDNGFSVSLREGQPPGCRWLPMLRDVVPVLHAADVVTLPAQWQEPFGRVVIEGLASGRPVVATSVGGIPEILTGDFRSMLVEPGDRRGLAARIGSLRNWRTADPGLAARCTRHVLDGFSLDATVDGVEHVLTRTVATRGRGRAAPRKASDSPPPPPPISRRSTAMSIDDDLGPAIGSANSADGAARTGRLRGRSVGDWWSAYRSMKPLTRVSGDAEMSAASRLMAACYVVLTMLAALMSAVTGLHTLYAASTALFLITGLGVAGCLLAAPVSAASFAMLSIGIGIAATTTVGFAMAELSWWHPTIALWTAVFATGGCLVVAVPKDVRRWRSAGSPRPRPSTAQLQAGALTILGLGMVVGDAVVHQTNPDGAGLLTAVGPVWYLGAGC